jgi:argininosuccinate synthase
MSIKKVVLAYSGGLDTSAIVPWLKDNYDCEVIAFVANVGQGDEELAGVEEKAIKSGASSCYVVDLREELIKEVIYPTLKTGAVYEGQYLLGTSMARPVIARAQVELALKLGADALCHGCTGKGNDQVRFEGAFAALAPQLKVIAPWREWQFNSRQSLLNYLAEKNVPTTASATKIYSRDANLWHISHEGGEIENPWNEPSDQIWMWTKSPEQAPDKAEHIQLSFEKGELTKINGEVVAPVKAIEMLNAIGSEHGVGRIDIVENRLVGMKSRGCYETPGGTILVAALRALESLVYDRTSLKYREEVGLEFAQLVYDGRWFTPLKDALLAAATSLADQLT